MTMMQKKQNEQIAMSTQALQLMRHNVLSFFVEKSHATLMNDTGSMTLNAMDYLKDRGMTDQTIIDNKIGYISKYDKVPDEIIHYGNDLLPQPKDENEKPRNLIYFLLDKIVVPIYDEFGLVVGLATRTPSHEKGHSWWNMPAPFYKGNHLFLLNKNKEEIFKQNKIYLVEGYMDALILSQYGLKTVVAVMGTALTLRKIGLIARYCNQVCICFDFDKNKAGQNAMNKSVAQLNKLLFCDKIAVIDDLPMGVDPDDFVIKNGVEEFCSHEKVLTGVDISNIVAEIKAEKKRKLDDARSKYNIK